MAPQATATCKISGGAQVPQPAARRLVTLLGGLIAWAALMSVVPPALAGAMGYTGRLPLFALSNAPTYTPAQAHAFLAAYGSAGRLAYAVSLALFDVVFPILYGGVLSTGLRLVAHGAHLAPRAQRAAGRVPFIATGANWAADVCILALLFAYPSPLAPAAVAAAVLTLVKFAALGASFMCLLAEGAYLLARASVRRMGRAMLAFQGGR
jgi:hypothetical protein